MYFGKIFIEFWENDKWNLSAVWFWEYIIMRLWGYCGCKNSLEYNIRHVPRNQIKFL